jgi:carbonic anhydrase/acetyltransferase-like protein (isoleucine patch superfamily)
LRNEGKKLTMPILPYKGRWPTIAAGAFVAPTATVVGDVTIEEGASVWFGAVIRADEERVVIGRGSNVQDNCTIHIDNGVPCLIGVNCTLGHGAIVHGATIGDGALIGMHATVLSHARIGADAIVAAGSLVPEGKEIAAGSLVVGVPARALRETTAAERQRAAEGVAHYQAYAEEYRRALVEASTARPQFRPL